MGPGHRGVVDPGDGAHVPVQAQLCLVLPLPPTTAASIPRPQYPQGAIMSLL